MESITVDPTTVKIKETSTETTLAAPLPAKVECDSTDRLVEAGVSCGCILRVYLAGTAAQNSN